MRNSHWLVPVIVLLLCGTLTTRAQDASHRTIAVLDFSNNSITEREKYEPLRKGLAEFFITELSQVAALTVVERERLKEVVTELEFGQTDVVDPATARRMGKILGAEYLVLGGFVHVSGSQLRIDARIVGVETGRTVRAVKQTGDLDDLFDLVKKMSEEITKNIRVAPDRVAASRSRTMPAHFDVTLAYARAIDAEDLARNDQRLGNRDDARLLYQKARDLLEAVVRQNPDFRDAIERLQRVVARLAEL